MKSITFYSYKGGAGRTLAAANFAVYLARLGLRTIMVDMDLEAPGVDSKFPSFNLPTDQRGVLDYILAYQNSKQDPGSVKDLCVEIPIATPRGKCSVGLIPAGDYLAPDYSRKLNELDWSRIFDKEGTGVAFFKHFLTRIENELHPDFLLIDSRTGIGEIGGICTQILADEVVILSSLASESVKMTRNLVDAISSSEIAKSLGKQVTVKVVLSRIPKPDDPTLAKGRYSKQFGIDEKKLFFLFSSPALEREEFIALLGTQKDHGLIQDYIRLFHGLDIQLADKSIRDQIQRTESSLLSVSPEQSEQAILEMAALYPHPEVYRAAMRYYRLRGKAEGVSLQGWRLLEVKPDDEEAQNLVVESGLNERIPMGSGFRRTGKTEESARLCEVGWNVFNRHRLSPHQLLSLAGLYEEVGDFDKAHQVAMATVDAKLPPEWKVYAYSLAARTALKNGQTEIVRELIGKIPPDQLRGPLAEFAVKTLMDAGEPGNALDLALTILQQDITMGVVALASELAHKLSRVPDVVAVLSNSSDIGYLVEQPDIHEKLIRLGLEDVLRALPPEIGRARRRR